MKLALDLGPEWRDPRRPTLWMILIVVAALAFRVLFIAQPLPWLVSMMTADDFYYYAGTAHHIAAGHGSTIDGGLTEHNGYHPLFLWLLVPGFALGIGKSAMIPVALLILTAAWLVAMVLAYRVGRTLGADWGALVAPAVMGLNVELVKLSLSGFETALAVAGVLAVLLTCLERRAGWVVGLLLGLASLARLDNAMLALPVAVVMLQQRRWRDLVIAGAVSAVVVSPWVLWSWINFGSPLPLSGVVKAWFGRPEDLWQGLTVFARESVYRLAGFRWRDVLPADLALVVGTLIVASVVRRQHRHWWLLLYALGAPVAYAVLTGSHHLAQFTRYTTPAFCLVAVLFFSAPWRRPRILLALVLISVLWGNHQFVRWSLGIPHHAGFVGVAQREVPAILDEIAGPDDLVGCFDSGAVGYFANRPVVNLDGLVNREVVEMLAPPGGPGWPDRYRDYFRRKGITVMVGGLRFSWSRLFDDLEQWPVLHEPVPSVDGGEIVFLRVPDPE